MASTKVKKSKPKTKSRQELRKEKRAQKKQNKFQFFSKKKPAPGTLVKNSKKNSTQPDELNNADNYDDDIESDFDLSDDEMNSKFSKITKSKTSPKDSKFKAPPSANETDRFLQSQVREKKQQKELEKKMRKRRIGQLKEANEDEDKVIRKLEKKLHIEKHRNEKSVHKMFNDGLDYALELCLPDNIQKMYSAAKEAANLDEDSENEFQEDLATALGETAARKSTKIVEKKKNVEISAKPSKLESSIKKNKKLKEIESKYIDNLESDLSGSDSEMENDNDNDESNHNSESDYSENSEDADSDFDILGDEEEVDDNSENGKESVDDSENDSLEEDDFKLEASQKNLNREVHQSSDNNSEEEEGSENDNINSNQAEENQKGWEDIYGRNRDADGNVLESNLQKYIPPHVRLRLERDSAVDPNRKEKLERLKKHCKGSLNRLSEANMHKIASDIEKLYMNNPRFDMNNALTQLILDALVSNVLAKERMVLEHIMLVSILHVNVGSEVGAHFLQSVINEFTKLVVSIENLDTENKELDNIIFILAHLYTYKIFQHNLVFEIIQKLVEKLCEKSVECLLLMLRSVGFQLRKDDPTALKTVILSVQKKANDSKFDIKENPRFKFMLEILNAIKNNNVNKIPQYDPELAEHLKKILKSMFSNGKYLSTLNITMDDLLNADEKGKWWVVGSAWSGNIKDIGSAKQTSSTSKHGEKFSEKLLELAKKQRMNTEDRRNVFCIIMSAEDYIDGFERLLHLSLKDKRTIASVLIHCCVSEKEFNPYYAVLAQKFSEYDRKYQLAVQFSCWDRIKDLQSATKQQIKNLAQFLIFLITKAAQPISILKVIEFAELDKVTLRLVRQIFLGILLGTETECQQVFERIAPSMKLNNFKDSIKLFMHHFLLKGTNKEDIPKTQLDLLKQRISLADSTLAFSDSKFRF